MRTGRRREDPVALLEQAYRLLENDDLDGARAQAERALKLDPELSEARGCLAEIALARGDEDEAVDQLRLALEVDPENPEALYALAELLAGSDPDEALELVEHATGVVEEELAVVDDDEQADLRHLLVEVVLLWARVLVDTEREALARQILGRLDKHVSWLLDDAGREDGRRAVLELAGARQVLGELEKSAELCRQLIARLEALEERAAEAGDQPAVTTAAPDEEEDEIGPCAGCLADAYYGLGLVLEDQDRHVEAVQCLARVADLDRQEPRSPFGLTSQRFEELAGEALGELPPVLADKIGHVPVVVADYPSSALIADGLDPRILGFFAGVPYHEQGSAALPRPTCIYLFHRNIERGCESTEEVEQEIRTTVLHEAGHYFGLSEEDLHERGLG